MRMPTLVYEWNFRISTRVEIILVEFKPQSLMKIRL